MFIALKWFGGMIPRRGNQHLPAPHATEAENCNLYSGELRPLKQPALFYQFCRPDQECWRTPIPEDPSVPPEPPPEPPACISVTIVTQPVIISGTPTYVAGEVIQIQVTVNSDATAPVQYQWLRDNEAIAGSVDPILTWTLSTDDTNVSFTVLVQNPCGQVISQPVTIPIVAPPPSDCPAWEAEAYNDALLNYATVVNPSGHVWLMNDDPGSTFVQGTTGVNLTENLGLTYAQPAILDGGTSSIYYAAASFARARTSALPVANTQTPTGFQGVLAQRVPPATEPGNLLFVEYHITPGLFNFQVTVGTNGPTGLRVVVTVEGSLDGPATRDHFGVVDWAGTCPNNAHVVSIWHTWSMNTDVWSYVLYVDHVEVARETGSIRAPSGAAATGGGRLLFGNSGDKDSYMSHGYFVEGQAEPTAAELGELQTGLAQNCESYVPPEYCPPTGCDPYACDAFYTELAVFAQEWWPFDDADDEYSRNVLNPTRTIRCNANSTVRPVSYPYDACVGDLGEGRFIDGVTGARTPDGTTDDPQTYTVDEVGTVGFFVDKIGAGDLVVFDFDWGSFSRIRITLSSGIDFTIDLPGSGADSTRATGSLYDGKYSIVSWNVNRVTGAWRVRCWSDFELTYDEGGIANTPTSTETFNPAMRFGRSAGSGTAGVRDYIYAPRWTNSADLAALKLAWQRNFASYTVPPECN